MILFWKILNPDSASWFTDFRLVMLILGFIAGVDLSMLIAALMAAGKEKKNGNKKNTG